MALSYWTVEIIGDEPENFKAHTFACCNMATRQLFSLSSKHYANCIIQEVFWPDRIAKVALEGIVKLKIGCDDPGSRYSRLPLFPGLSLRCGKNGYGVWSDAMSSHQRAILLEQADEVGQVCYVRLV